MGERPRPAAGSGTIAYGIDMDPLQRVPANQAPLLVGHDTIESDAALVGAVQAFAGEEASGVRSSLGNLDTVAGSAEAREHGMLANENPPRLRATDRYGSRVDEVDFHPS